MYTIMQYVKAGKLQEIEYIHGIKPESLCDSTFFAWAAGYHQFDVMKFFIENFPD